jgi:hypothetical protein
VHPFAVESITVLFAFGRLGKRAYVDPIIDRDLSLIAFGIGLELPGFDVDGNVVLAVCPLLRGRLQRAVGKNRDVFEQVLDQILQVGRRLFA